MKLKVVCVEPKYQINLGYVARVLKNFGFKELDLIAPRCNYRGAQAIKYSKHARELLENAKVYKNLDEISKNALLIGTTGIWKKSDVSFYNIYNIEKVSKMIKRNADAKNIVILLGRDDTGLTKEELRKCDACLFIGAESNYPVMNISHALAIVLYELTKSKFSKEYSFDRLYADMEYQKRIVGLFHEMIKGNKNIRDKESVLMAFRHVINRSMPTKSEINALAIALSQKSNKIKKKK